MEGRMSRMVRISSVLGLALAAMAGCGNNGGNTPNNGDMAVAPIVDSGPGAKDISMPPMTGAKTGEACKASADCQRSMAPGNAAAACTKMNMLGGGPVTWVDGY